LITDECRWSAGRDGGARSCRIRHIAQALEFSERAYGADVTADLKAEFQAFYGKNLPPDRLVLDVLEEDDARSFPRKG
jgi:hypothetical protein